MAVHQLLSPKPQWRLCEEAPPSLCSGFLRGQSWPGLISPCHAYHPPSEVFLAYHSVFPEQVGAGPLPVHYLATARHRAPRQNILGFA